MPVAGTQAIFPRVARVPLESSSRRWGSGLRINNASSDYAQFRVHSPLCGEENRVRNAQEGQVPDACQSRNFPAITAALAVPARQVRPPGPLALRNGFKSQSFFGPEPSWGCR